MKNHYFILFICLFICNCGGSSSGGKKSIIDNQPVQQNKIWRIANGDSAALEDAFAQAIAGDTVEILAGPKSFRSNSESAEGLSGFVVRNSGTYAKPIIITGIAVAGYTRPVIDQGKQTAANLTITKPVAGLILPCVNFIKIENVEIRNAQSAGISSSLKGCPSQHISIKNNLIHRIYGGQLSAAIRLANSSNIDISHNQLEQIYKTTNASETTFISSQIPQHNIQLNNNVIKSTAAGVQLKQSQAELHTLTISGNQFIALSKQAIVVDSASNTLLDNVNINNNHIESSPYGLRLNHAANNMANDLQINDNVFTDLNVAISIQGGLSIALRNTHFSHITQFYLQTDRRTASYFTLWDYNQYQASPNAGWLVGEDFYSDLPSWQNFINSRGIAVDRHSISL